MSHEGLDAITRLPIPYFNGTIMRGGSDSQRINIDSPDTFDMTETSAHSKFETWNYVPEQSSLLHSGIHIPQLDRSIETSSDQQSLLLPLTSIMILRFVGVFRMNKDFRFDILTPRS